MGRLLVIIIIGKLRVIELEILAAKFIFEKKNNNKNLLTGNSSDEF